MFCFHSHSPKPVVFGKILLHVSGLKTSHKTVLGASLSLYIKLAELISFQSSLFSRLMTTINTHGLNNALTQVSIPGSIHLMVCLLRSLTALQGTTTQEALTFPAGWN